MNPTKLTPKPKPIPTMQDIYRKIQQGKVKSKSVKGEVVA